MREIPKLTALQETDKQKTAAEKLRFLCISRDMQKRKDKYEKILLVYDSLFSFLIEDMDSVRINSNLDFVA